MDLGVFPGNDDGYGKDERNPLRSRGYDAMPGACRRCEGSCSHGILRLRDQSGYFISDRQRSLTAGLPLTREFRQSAGVRRSEGVEAPPLVFRNVRGRIIEEDLAFLQCHKAGQEFLR
jgi:hypothetical protein